MESDSDVDFNNFPDIEKVCPLQYPIETEVRQQITDGHTIPSDQMVSHEGVSKQLKHEKESRESDCAAEGSLLWSKYIQNSNSSCKVEIHLEPIE